MEEVEQIKKITLETGNFWFSTHNITKIAYEDLIINAELKEEGIDAEEADVCTCDTKDDCNYCDIEVHRHVRLDELNLYKSQNGIYNFEISEYTKTHWITHIIDGNIQGFILLKCYGGKFQQEGFTTELVFACVRPSYRKKGILQDMINRIPNGWNIWLEASSLEIKNIERVWERCGFSFHTQKDGCLIYKKHT